VWSASTDPRTTCHRWTHTDLVVRASARLEAFCDLGQAPARRDAGRAADRRVAIVEPGVRGASSTIAPSRPAVRARILATIAGLFRLASDRAARSHAAPVPPRRVAPMPWAPTKISTTVAARRCAITVRLGVSRARTSVLRAPGTVTARTRAALCRGNDEQAQRVP